MTDSTLSRNDEIAQIHAEYRNFYRLLAGGALVALGVVIGALLFSGNTPAIEDITGYFTNLYTEAVSIVLTISVLNFLQERREERRRIKDLQEQLVREAGSSVNATARSAINTIRRRDWLGRSGMHNTPNDSEALLKNADLRGANLQDEQLERVNLSGANLKNATLNGANLTHANLNGANLRETNLSGIFLSEATLSKANLIAANLNGADLRYATLNDVDSRYATMCDANLHAATLSRANLHSTDLSNTRLWDANLNGADLREANLQDAFLGGTNLSNAMLSSATLSGADLRETNLRSADLRETKLNDTLIQPSTHFDENTVLPDGSKWSDGRDLSEFDAETREIANTVIQADTEGSPIFTYNFIDGVTRRWQLGKGWLDDRDGNPLEG